MPLCVVPTCKNSTTNKKHGITFHRFPNDEVRRARWTNIIRGVKFNKTWKPSSFSVVCSSHFEEKHLYVMDNGFNRLCPEAYPSQNMVCKEDLISGKKFSIIETNVEHNQKSETVSKQKTLSAKTNKKKSDKMDRALQLKLDLQRLSLFNTNYKKKVRAIQKRNARLSDIIEHYENAFSKIKNKEIDKEVLSNLVMEGIVKTKDITKIKLKILQTVKQTRKKSRVSNK